MGIYFFWIDHKRSFFDIPLVNVGKHKGIEMKRSFKFLALIFLCCLIQFTPQRAMACVEGLSWGMGVSTLESHFGMPLTSIQEREGRDVFEVKNFQISGLPVNSLRFLVAEENGL